MVMHLMGWGRTSLLLVGLLPSPQPWEPPAVNRRPQKKGTKKVSLSTSPTIVETAPATTISSATVGTGSEPPSKKKPPPKKILCVVVSKSSNMNIRQIMELYGTSRSIEPWVSVTARPQMNVTDGITKPASGVVQRSLTWNADPGIEWIRDHLAGTPDPHVADVLAESWRADVTFHPLDSNSNSHDIRFKRAEHALKLSLKSCEGK